MQHMWTTRDTPGRTRGLQQRAPGTLQFWPPRLGRSPDDDDDDGDDDDHDDDDDIDDDDTAALG